MSQPVSLVYFKILLVTFCDLVLAIRGFRWLLYMTQSSAHPSFLVGTSIPLDMEAIATKYEVMLVLLPVLPRFL
jgi:hypothetical protein